MCKDRQVRFKCLSTPMRGPNNKPLAFVVHGSHSYELAGFLSIAFLGRLASNEELLSSLSLINRSFCSKNTMGNSILDNANRERGRLQVKFKEGLTLHTS